MRRAKVTYRPSALADLRTIYRIVADVSGSHLIATRFVNRILVRCRKIGDAPRGGRPRDDLLAGLRVIPFERSAVIAYMADNTVEIINVFYGGRDYEALYHDVSDAELNQTLSPLRDESDV